MEFDAKEFLTALFVEAGELSPVPEVEPDERLSAAPTCPSELPSDWREEFEERAAIREYDGGQCRAGADRDAFQEITARVRAAGLFP